MTSPDRPEMQNPFEVPDAANPIEPRPFGWKFFAVCIVIVAGILFLLMPMTRRAPQAAHRTQCMNNLKNISLALLSYAESHGRFPPAYTTDASGNRLHSWRTLILPYLDQSELYDKIDLSKPWNHPDNQKVFERAPSIYQCPSAKADDRSTVYVAAIGPTTVIRPGESLAWTEITDHHYQTILVLEVPDHLAVDWMSPEDVSADTLTAPATLEKTQHIGVFNVGLADGTIMPISTTIDSNVLRSLTTATGGEVFDDKNF